ncbi:ABC transporter ATP-binding protein [Nocardioides sp.]|uniref:ABC transporter ATP-binding protein n=1 Tax=Nocardioides sp. TaxID=35761 RepID=UPI003D09718F
MPASSETSAPDLVLDGCTKRFHTAGREVVTALDHVDLSVEPGTFVSIIGSNGAGKSTMLSLIAGSLLADEGRILVRDHDVTTMPSWKRIRRVSRVRQNPQDNMVSTLTIEENFALALAGKKGRFALRRTSSSTVREIAAEVLRPLGMGLEDRMSTVSGSLSGGQRQAIAVAMASLGSPAVMLLDEHVAALDPNSAARVNEVTERIVRDQQITALMVTHDMGHALTHADRLLMMHQGRIVLDFEGSDLTGLTVRDLQQRFVRLSGGTLSDAAILSAEGETRA